ncbi:MAG: MlaD family protein, partial [Pseudomonadota bacterium]
MKKLNILLVAAMLSACGLGGFTVNTEFDSAEGLEVGKPVLFNNEEIGSVTKVEEGLNSTKVSIKLNSDKVELLNTKSAVVINQMKTGSPLEFFNQGTDGAEPLVNGQEVRGFDSLMEMGAWMVGDAIQLGTGTLSDYVDAFTDYLKGEQFEEDKAAVQQQLSEAASSAQEALQTVETDMNQALEQLKESEVDISAAISQLGDELSPLIKELSVSGASLIQQLEQFAEGVEADLNENPDIGQDLLNSLIETFQKLDDQIKQEFESGGSLT